MSTAHPIYHHHLRIGRLVAGIFVALTVAGCASATPVPAEEQPVQTVIVQQPAQNKPTVTTWVTSTEAPSATEPVSPTDAQPALPSPAETSGSSISTGGAPGLSQIDACTLVTKDEAEALLGVPVKEPKIEEVATLKSCAYETDTLDGVSVSVLGFRDAEQAGEAFQQMIDFNDYKEVTGIGERAIRTYPFDDITVLFKNFHLGVDVTNDGDEDQQFEQARELAEKALSRMP